MSTAFDDSYHHQHLIQFTPRVVGITIARKNIGRSFYPKLQPLLVFFQKVSLFTCRPGKKKKNPAPICKEGLINVH